MSMLAVPISSDISRLFREVEAEGNREPSDHITMIYFGDDMSIKDITKVIPIIHEITQDLRPFTASTKKITTFPKGEYGYPIIAPIDCKGLVQLQDDLKKEFKKNKIKFSDKYPEYNPHITLGYYKRKTKNMKFPKVEFQINEIALFGGNEGKERLYVSFPFSLGIEKKAGYVGRLVDEWNSVVK